MAAMLERMLRPEAIAIAKAFVAELEGTYDQLIVAGSLRRRLATAHDIEIVAVPTLETVTGGLFGDEGTTIDRLDARMTTLLEQYAVVKRLDKNGSPRWGPRLKYLLYRGARVDLFSPGAQAVGWHLVLRTGPVAFSRQLVRPRGLTTRDGRPGLLPPLIKPREGFLTWGVSGEHIETPDEQEVYRLFGLAYQEPWERT